MLAVPVMFILLAKGMVTGLCCRVTNACDAIVKLHRVMMKGTWERILLLVLKQKFKKSYRRRGKESVPSLVHNRGSKGRYMLDNRRM